MPVIKADDVWDDLIAKVVERSDDYVLYQSYYDGVQKLPINSQEFQSRFGTFFATFRDNLARPIVEIAEGRVRVREFGNGQGLASDAGRLWRRNKMDVESRWVHTQAMVKGDSYVIVLPDEDNNPGIWPQIADSCAIVYDPINPRKKLAAMKWWVEEFYPTASMTKQPFIRVNLYFDDRIERYRSTSQGDTLFEDFDKYEVYEDEGSWKSRHKVGEVPMFEFNANYDISVAKGRSDLADAGPLIDAVNKTFLDMMVSSEYTAAPQRWATGVEIPLDPKTGEPMKVYEGGADRLWTAPSEGASFGQFEGGALDGYKDAISTLVDHLAFISRTPTYALMRENNYPAGEALKSAEGPLRQRVGDHQQDFGMVWAEVLQAALKLDGTEVADEELEDITPAWMPVNAPFATREFLEEIKVKAEVAGVPEEMLWRELGYTQAQIEEMKEMREQEATVGVDATANLQAEAILQPGTPEDATAANLLPAEPAAAPPNEAVQAPQ